MDIIHVLKWNQYEYEVEWPPLVERDTSERIADAMKILQAARQYVGPQGAVQEIIPVEEFRELLGLDPEIPETEHPTAGAGDSLAGDYSAPLSHLPMYDNDHPPKGNGILRRLRNFLLRGKSSRNRLKYARHGVIMNASQGNCSACGKFLDTKGSCNSCAGIGKEAFDELSAEYNDALVGLKVRDVPKITGIDNHGMVRAIERGWTVEDIEEVLANKRMIYPGNEPGITFYMTEDMRRVGVSSIGIIRTMFGG